MTRTISARWIREHDVIDAYGSHVTILDTSAPDADGLMIVHGYFTVDGVTGYTVNLYVNPAERFPLIQAHYDA